MLKSFHFNLIHLAAIVDRLLNFSVKIPVTYAHLCVLSVLSIDHATQDVFPLYKYFMIFFEICVFILLF